MSEYSLNDRVSFVLPQEYGFSRSVNDEGNEIYSIFKGYSVDDDGEESYVFKCTVRETIVERNAAIEGKSFKELWVNAFRNQENIRYLTLPGKPDALMLTLGTGINIFGRMLKLVSLTLMVAVDEDSFLTIISSKGYDEEEPEQYLPVVENMLTVANAIVIEGNGSALEPVDAADVLDALKPTFDGSAAAEVSVRFAGQAQADSGFQMTKVQPEERLYPHYLSIKENPTSMLGLLGVNVQVNATGMEYEFKSLQKELAAAASDPDSGLSESYRAIYQRMVDADASEYYLDQRAREMLPLFRVDPSVFDRKHDRECELAEGYMHRAYMMSALRSFAWTLSDWCRKKNIQPEDVLYGDLQYMISFLSRQEWLNYDADTYCAGLCGCQDLHVYYVPEEASSSDKQALMPDAEYLAQIAAMKKRFPGYREIPAQVHSLDALREDLGYLLPAIETIYDVLEEERNRMETLSGDAADILYAWCALALAAKGPFFTEDGPTGCWFTQKTDEIPMSQKQGRSENANPVMAKKAALEDCQISSGILKKYEGNDPAIILPEGIYAIGTDAFLFNKTLKTVIISDEVETIESDAFWGCGALEEVVFPQSLRTIGKNAFRDCGSLRTIIIPEGVREIDEDAFTSCKQLKDIYLPASLWSIGNDAFCTFNDETVLHAPKGSDAAQYADEHNLKVDHKETTAAKRKPQKRKSAAVKKTQVNQPDKQIRFAGETSAVLDNGLVLPVPDGYRCCAEGTGENAGWTYIVPDGVADGSNHIDAKPYGFAVTVSSGARIAFESKYIEALKNVFLSKGYLAAQIPVESLIVSENCGFLYQNRMDDTDATYNKVNGFLFAGEDVFQFHIYANYNSGIGHEQKTIDDFLRICREWMQRIRLSAEISQDTLERTTQASDPRQLTLEECNIDEDGAFEGYYGTKTEIILPDTIRKIGKYCKFSENVESITIPDSVTVIDEDAFYQCSQLKHITLPDSIVSIGESAFWGCCGLETITIPKGVSVLEDYTFYECSGLKRITIPGNVKKIGSSAFGKCSELSCVTISGSTGEVSSFAFYKCSNVKKVIVSADSKTVPYWVNQFRESVEEVILADGITHIEEEAFYDCTSLKSIALPENLVSIGRLAFCGCTNLTELVIPDTVTTIEECAFLGCSNIQSVNIPAGVSAIEEMTFCDCKSLTVIDIPDNVTSIGPNAFQGCCELASVLIPQSVTFIDKSAFQGCGKLVDVAIPDGVAGLEKDFFEKKITEPGQQEEWDVDENGVFRGYRGYETEITLPDHVVKIEGFEAPGVKKVIIPGTVETIAECAFFGCGNLEEIVVLDGVVSIEESAFAECTGLKHIVLPNTLQIIEDSTFESCESLQQIRIPQGVTELGDHVFNGCRSLASAELPEGLTKIGAFAFNDCENLKDLTIVESVLEIGEYAFSGCSALPAIKLPAQMTAISEAVFQNCSGLKEVILPEKITSIGSTAFSGCSGLTGMIIPESVTSIEEGAFSSCEGIREIRLPVRLRGCLAKNLFGFCKQLERIVVPAGITEIAESAFTCCEKLTDVHLPPFIQKIHDWAFIGRSEDVVFHVVKGSYTERFCQEKGYRYDHNLDSELVKVLQTILQARKARAAAQKKAEEERKLQERRDLYQQYEEAMERQNTIISQNRGLFGIEARNRKAAQERLAQLRAQLAIEFPDGKP